MSYRFARFHRSLPENGGEMKLVMSESKREVKPTRARRVTYRFPSRKMNSVIVVEEWIEHAYCFECEFDREVVAYSAQPFQLLLVDDDWTPKALNRQVFKRYTPDFYVEWADGTAAVVECKPERLISGFQLENRAVLQELSSLDLEFRVYTSKEARTSRMDNLKFLYPYAQSLPDLSLRKVILKRIASSSETRLSDCLSSVEDEAAVLRELYAMIFDGLVCCDLGKRISRDLLLSVANRGGSNARTA
jgi:hypothetical protein